MGNIIVLRDLMGICEQNWLWRIIYCAEKGGLFFRLYGGWLEFYNETEYMTTYIDYN